MVDSWGCIFYNPVHCRWKHIHPQEQKIQCDSYRLHSLRIIELYISFGHKGLYYSGVFFINHVFFSFLQFRWKGPSCTLHNNAILAPGIQFPALDPFEEWKVMLQRKKGGGLFPIRTSPAAVLFTWAFEESTITFTWQHRQTKRPCWQSL